MSEAQAVGPAVNEIAFAPADVVKEDLPGGGFILLISCSTRYRS